MKLGIAATTSVTPATTAMAQADYVRRIARTAEDAGYDSVWISDRTVYPTDLAARYPDQFGPGKSNPDAQNVLEAISTLSYIAGMTSRVKLGMSVLVAPFRHPVLNAKMLTTLDVLSGGRLIAGFGTGWMPEEFEAMNAEYAMRGKDTDEHIFAFKAMCEGADFEGRITRMTGMTFFPKPIQIPHPPIWIGGNSTAAKRRAVRLADGWHGIKQTPDQISEARREIESICVAHRRNSTEITISLRATLSLGKQQRLDDGGRSPLSGEDAAIVDDLGNYREAGLDYLVLSIDEPTEDATADTAMRIAELAGSR